MPFQTALNYHLAPGLEGDFASVNPYGSMLSSEGSLISGPGGVTAGRFAWADAAGIVRNNGSYAGVSALSYATPSGLGRLGFVHRDQPALITTWLAETSMVVQPGIEIAVYDSGDFWCKFAAGAIPGQKVYAYFSDGTAYAAATGTPPAGGSSATATYASATASVTASIAPVSPFNGKMLGGIMTVTVIGSGTLYPGALLTGGSIVTGTQILQQLTGTAGGVGTYLVSISQTQASTTVTATYGLFTATGASSTAFAVGQIFDTVTATGTITAGTTITAFITGTGKNAGGTYVGSAAPTGGNVTSSTITTKAAVETSWYVQTYAAAGELAKISVRHGV